MKAIGYTQPSETVAADSLQEYEVDIPVATARDLLVEVKAVSVNPVDTKLRGRINPAPNMKILGYDAVGTVKAVGDNVSLFKVGDRVFYAGDMTRQGSNAQYQLVDERIVGFAPKSISDAQAAALPLTAVTAWELLFDRLQLDNDSTQSLLVIGAAGSIGQAVCKEIFRRQPQILHVIDISENNLVELVRDLRSSFGYIKGEFKTFAIDCASIEFEVLFKYQSSYDYILNLSALKHVRSEKDPYTLMRMINTNIFSVLNTIKLAESKKVKKYFCVSTDKAANPVNLMGASKKLWKCF